MSRPGRRPGSSGGRVTFGSVVGVLLLEDGDELLVLSLGGSSRPPVLPPSRPSPPLSELELDGCGLPLLGLRPEEPLPVALGAGRPVCAEPPAPGPVPCCLPSARSSGGRGSSD